MAALSMLAFSPDGHAQAIPINGTTTYTQNFDSLPTVAANWVDNGTLTGWYADCGNTFTSGPTNPLPIAIYTTGAFGVRGFFSAGSGTERALAVSPTTVGYGACAIGVVFKNESSSSIAITNIAYTGELYVPQNTASTLDGFQFFYQVSGAPVTDLTLGGATQNNGSSYANNAALSDAGWTRLSSLDYATSSLLTTPRNPAVATSISASTTITLAPGQYVTFRWRNFNDSGTDAIMGIDDLSVTFAAVSGPLVYNLTHTVGGAPNGSLESSAAQYWLDGSTPVGNLTLGNLAFSQAPAVTASINVPADITVSRITLSNPSGEYIFDGPGRISGPFEQSNGAPVRIHSANAFSTVVLAGGNVVTRNPAAFGNAPIAMNGAVNLDVGDGGLAIGGGLNGTGMLTKTGTGTLAVNGTPGNATGGLVVAEGSLSTSSGSALGAAAQVISLNGTSIEFTNVGTATVMVPSIAIGAGGLTIVAAENSNLSLSGVAFQAGRLVGSAPVVKAGPGVLRMTGPQSTLTSNWTINSGTLEAAAANGMGTGTVLVNPSATLGLTGNTLSNSVTLAGGMQGVRASNVTAPIENFGGPIAVTTDSFFSVRRTSTFSTYNGFSIGGVLSGAHSVTLIGPVLPPPSQETPINQNLTNLTSTLGAVTLTNPGNTYSGNFIV